MRTALTIALAVLGLAASPAAAAPADATRDPIDRAQPPAPDGTPVCADWVHERHSVRRGGRRWATWHPPVDPRYGCAFGHEHGSSPRASRYFSRAGMPAFGPIGAYAGRDEAHPGFKVFVANEDRKGFAWMIVVHQGSGSPRRAAVRHHSMEAWLFRNRGRRLIAHTRAMADFGDVVLNCGPKRPRGGWRLLPTPGCRPAYEEWAAALDVGGALRARPGFGIQNPITQFDPADPARVVFNKPTACGPFDPGGWSSRCKGDRRVLRHPRWSVRNSGPSARFRTDAYGRRSASGLLQLVSRRVPVRQGGEAGGVENTFVMERPSDGGLYRAGRGTRSAGFEHAGLCVLRSN